MPAKMKDVARLAGVSTATVSRALNTPDVVSDETHRRVMAAIDELGYKVNVAARHLRTNRTGTIAIVLPTIADPVINRAVEAVEDAAIERNYTLLLCSTRGEAEREQAYIRLLTQQTVVDGVLYLSPRAAPEDVLRLAHGDAPLVLCNYVVDSAHTPCVLLDHVSSIYQATRHLLALGHRRIALLSLDAPYYYPARMRREGFEKAFAEVGAAPDTSLIAEIHQPTYATGEWSGTIQSLLALSEPPTAIVAFNDEVALQVYAISRKHGIRIPRDLSVTGCDDILSARHVEPALTTVQVPAYTLGQVAIERLLHRIDQARVPQMTVLDVELVIRASTAPPRRHA